MFVDPKTPVSAAESGYGSGTVTNTSTALTTLLARPDDANMAIIQFEDVAGAFTSSEKICRVRVDGTAPTASEGLLFGDTNFLELKTVAEINNCNLISAEGSNTVTVRIQYYKRGF